MKKFFSLIALIALVYISPKANAGSITIYNLTSSYTFSGYLIGANTFAGASPTNYYEQFVSVAAGGSLTYANPTLLPSPAGPGLPALATGLFIGIKGAVLGLPSNNGAVGRTGNYMGYPTSQTNSYYTATWNQSGSSDNAIILVL